MLRSGKLFYSQNKLANWQQRLKCDIIILGNNMNHNEPLHEFAKVCSLDFGFGNKLIQMVQKFKTEFVDNASFL